MFKIRAKSSCFERVFEKSGLNCVADTFIAFEEELGHGAGRTGEDSRAVSYFNQAAKPQVEGHARLKSIFDFVVVRNVLSNTSQEIPLDQSTGWFHTQFRLNPIIAFSRQAIQF